MDLGTVRRRIFFLCGDLRMFSFLRPTFVKSKDSDLEIKFPYEIAVLRPITNEKFIFKRSSEASIE
ncbi:hypothetical protein AYB33_07135 [Leptospira santarosai]|nr:hypothetical protein AYB33_07135 [Leptospira santarosai]